VPSWAVEGMIVKRELVEYDLVNPSGVHGPYSPLYVTNLALASGLQGLHHVMLGAQLCI
jgi:hypothetical protein